MKISCDHLVFENHTLKSQIKLLMDKIKRLEEENKRLQEALMERVSNHTVDWKKIVSNSKYDSYILQCVKKLLIATNAPVNTERIVDCVKRKICAKKGINAAPKSETIARRLRKLRELGVLASPAQGKYTLPAPKNTDMDS